MTNVSAATDNEKQFAKDFVEEATGENFVMLDKQKVYSLDETLCWYNNIFGVRCTEDVLFVKVADGHIDKANRYINFEDASLRWMVWLIEVEDHGI